MNKNSKTMALVLALLAGAWPLGAAETNPKSVARFVAICRGSGVIRPDYNGKLLTVGKEYSIVARPAAGYDFTNWTDGYAVVVTNHPRLKFVMKTNSMFIAHFVKRSSAASWLEGVSAADIPLKVLAAVGGAPPQQQAQVLAAWMPEVCAMDSAALPSVAATVVSAYPNLLSTAVTAAVSSCPDECYPIAQTLLAVNPNAGNIILQAIAATVPQLSAVLGTAGGGASLSESQTLAILSQALTAINWPLNALPPSQTPHDYSTP